MIFHIQVNAGLGQPELGLSLHTTTSPSIYFFLKCLIFLDLRYQLVSSSDSSWKIPAPIILPLRSDQSPRRIWMRTSIKLGVSPELVVFVEFFALQFVRMMGCTRWQYLLKICSGFIKKNSRDVIDFLNDSWQESFCDSKKGQVMLPQQCRSFGMCQSNCSIVKDYRQSLDCSLILLVLLTGRGEREGGGDATKNTPMRLERMKHMQQQPLSWIYR